MDLKSTIFAATLVAIITWRNVKCADLEGKKYRPYGLAELTSFVPDLFKPVKDRFTKKKKAAN